MEVEVEVKVGEMGDRRRHGGVIDGVRREEQAGRGGGVRICAWSCSTTRPHPW